jgi:hypothetical protein
MVRIFANPLDRNNWRLIVGKGVRPACGDWVEIGVGRPGVGLESQPASTANRMSITEAMIILAMPFPRPNSASSNCNRYAASQYNTL